MGDRYILTVTCPNCQTTIEDAYYAPTCGFVSVKCDACHYIINLESVTGISEKDASNKGAIDAVLKGFDDLVHGR